MAEAPMDLSGSLHDAQFALRNWRSNVRCIGQQSLAGLQCFQQHFAFGASSRLGVVGFARNCGENSSPDCLLDDCAVLAHVQRREVETEHFNSAAQVGQSPARQIAPRRA